jgi:hypothetical protein
MNREALELLHQFLISLGQPNSEPNLGQLQLAAFAAFIEEYNQGSRGRLHLLQLAQEVGLSQEGLAKLREVAWTLDLEGTQDWEFHPF